MPPRCGDAHEILEDLSNQLSDSPSPVEREKKMPGLLLLGLTAGGFLPATHLHAATSLRCGSPRANAAPNEDGGFEGQIALFAPRSVLPQIRGQRFKVQEQLEEAVDSEDYILAAQLRDDLAELRQKDPAVMANTMREELAKHVASEAYAEAARCRDRLLVLRRFLPQYSLAGLWKGNYPNHGDELVRLHYQGDTLIATKVTGDEHVPAGEVTFRADLTMPSDVQGDPTSIGGSDVPSPEPHPRPRRTPRTHHRNPELAFAHVRLRFVLCAQSVGVRVEVLSLSENGSHEPRDVEQFKGEGRIAARGFRHPHYVPGHGSHSARTCHRACALFSLWRVCVCALCRLCGAGARPALPHGRRCHRLLVAADRDVRRLLARARGRGARRRQGRRQREGAWPLG